MTLGQMDLSIILGRSQNQALDIIKTDMLISRCEDTEDYFMKSIKEYNRLVEVLFNLNKEQHERLTSIAPNVAKEIIPAPNVKKVIEPKIDKKQPKQPSQNQKICPQCSLPIPKTWKQHFECGWKEL